MIQTTPEIGKSIHAGGVMTNYHEAGSDTHVILIHGSGPGVSAWANWRLGIPYLSERLHFFAYDQVGFGYIEQPKAFNRLVRDFLTEGTE
jgi:2-hydroxymuconate-semialdehyde hydrolase